MKDPIFKESSPVHPLSCFDLGPVSPSQHGHQSQGPSARRGRWEQYHEELELEMALALSLSVDNAPENGPPRAPGTARAHELSYEVGRDFCSVPLKCWGLGARSRPSSAGGDGFIPMSLCRYTLWIDSPFTRGVASGLQSRRGPANCCIFLIRFVCSVLKDTARQNWGSRSRGAEVSHP
jgi:hypothetical protein